MIVSYEYQTYCIRIIETPLFLEIFVASAEDLVFAMAGIGRFLYYISERAGGQTRSG
jgi:hypothetical protein